MVLKGQASTNTKRIKMESENQSAGNPSSQPNDDRALKICNQAHVPHLVSGTFRKTNKIGWCELVSVRHCWRCKLQEQMLYGHHCLAIKAREESSQGRGGDIRSEGAQPPGWTAEMHCSSMHRQDDTLIAQMG